MHTSRVNNFSVSDGTHDPFATVVVTLGAEDDDMQINSSMHTTGSDVTIFFRSLGDVIQFATNLLDQAKAEEKECPCENCTCSKEGK
jgi:hypothetical protein